MVVRYGMNADVSSAVTCGLRPHVCLGLVDGNCSVQFRNITTCTNSLDKHPHDKIRRTRKPTPKREPIDFASIVAL